MSDLTKVIAKFSRMWKDKGDQAELAVVIRALESRYSLNRKMTDEPGVEDILSQMVGRLAKSFGRLSNINGKKVLDIACGSITSKAPASLLIHTPFGDVRHERSRDGYSAQFEPWFCRILFEMGATPVGVDFGDLSNEIFEHHQVDLGSRGALDFLPDHSFDAVQDSRLFGSPEFTAQFPHRPDRVKVAQEIWRQERRLLKPNGIVIHSDAEALLK